MLGDVLDRRAEVHAEGFGLGQVDLHAVDEQEDVGKGVWRSQVSCKGLWRKDQVGSKGAVGTTDNVRSARQGVAQSGGIDAFAWCGGVSSGSIIVVVTYTKLS